MLGAFHSGCTLRVQGGSITLTKHFSPRETMGEKLCSKKAQRLANKYHTKDLSQRQPRIDTYSVMTKHDEVFDLHFLFWCQGPQRRNRVKNVDGKRSQQRSRINRICKISARTCVSGIPPVGPLSRLNDGTPKAEKNC